jgi:pilus assembly protein CpaB
MSKTFTMFLLAIVMAVGAAMVANTWLEKQRQATVEQAVVTVKTKPVVAASIEIPFGTTIQDNHLKIISVAEESASSNVFEKLEDVKGKIAKQAIYPGEIVRKERVANKGEAGGGTLAAIVTPNMRAITVRVNDVVGVAGFLLPGDHIDVLASRPSAGGNRKMETRTVLERIKVLAVDQTAATDKDTPVIVRAVTLEVTPEQALLLVEATQEGAVQLALRNPADASQAGVKVQLPPPPPAPVVMAEKAVELPPPPPPPQIIYKTIYREPPSTDIRGIQGTGSGIDINTVKVSP